LLLLGRVHGAGTINLGLAAGALTLQIFAGHPQFVFYTALVFLLEAVYPAFLAIETRTHGRTLWLIAVCGALALLWAIIQWLPAYELSREAPRLLTRTYKWAISYSVRPDEFLKMLFFPLWNRYFTPSTGDPNILGFYVGWPILAVAAWGVYRAPRRFHRYKASALMIGLLGGVLALGGFLPGYRVLSDVIVPLQFFRFPAQASYLVCFGIAVLAGIGLDAAGLRPKTAVGLIMLCAADLWAFSNGHSVSTIDAAFYSARTPTVEFLKRDATPERFLLSPVSRRQAMEQRAQNRLQAALRFQDALLSNLSMVHHLYDADGYEELRYKRYDDVLNELAQDPDSAWLNALGIRYVLSYNDTPPSPKFNRVARTSVNIYENAGALPFVYAPASVRFVNDARAVVRDEPGFEFRRTALLEGVPDSFVKVDPPPAPDDQPVLKEFRPGFMSIQSDSLAPLWIVVSESYDRGWSATANGSAVPIVRANSTQMALLAPGGKSFIELSYRPPYFSALVIISLISFFGFWAVCLWTARRRH
jgi:hypothetical protein